MCRGLTATRVKGTRIMSTRIMGTAATRTRPIHPATTRTGRSIQDIQPEAGMTGSRDGAGVVEAAAVAAAALDPDRPHPSIPCSRGDAENAESSNSTAVLALLIVPLRDLRASA
jgi:hypothetical protein